MQDDDELGAEGQLPDDGQESPKVEIQPDTQPTPRRSTIDRRPGQLFTYSSLGKPTYEPRPMVSTVAVQPLHYNK